MLRPSYQSSTFATQSARTRYADRRSAGRLTGADLPRLRRAGPAASDPKQTSESIRLAAYWAPLLHFRCGNSSDVEEAGDVDGQRISFVPQGSPSRAFHGPAIIP